MRGHLQAVASFLAPLGYPVHLFHAEGPGDGVTPPVPYLVLRGPSWDTGDEVGVCGGRDQLDTRVNVTAAASTAEGALVVLGRVRDLVGARAVLSVAGRAAQVSDHRSEVNPQIDWDLRLPNSNRHPGFGVDSYRLTSHPTA